MNLSILLANSPVYFAHTIFNNFLIAIVLCVRAGDSAGGHIAAGLVIRWRALLQSQCVRADDAVAVAEAKVNASAGTETRASGARAQAPRSSSSSSAEVGCGGGGGGSARQEREADHLVPIRMQLLLYPALQFVNLTTTSFLVHAWLFGGGPNLCRVWTRFAFAQPEVQFGTHK